MNAAQSRVDLSRVIRQRELSISVTAPPFRVPDVPLNPVRSLTSSAGGVQLRGHRDTIVTEARLDKSGGVAARDFPWLDDLAGRGRVRQPVEPEGPPVVPVQVESHEVPVAAQGHQLRRFDTTVALGTVGRRVVEPESLRVPAGLCNGDHVIGVDVRA